MNKKYDTGFTLVELLIAMGLLSVLLIVFTQIFVSALALQLRSESISTLQQDGTFIYSKLAHDFNQASAVTAPVNIGDTGQTLTLTISGQVWTYTVSNGNLTVTNPLGSFVYNGYQTQVDSWQLERVGNPGGSDQVKIDLTLRTRISGAESDQITSYSTTLGIR